MQKYTLYKPTQAIQADIHLPTSKSISNRVLIIDALCQENIPLKDISESEDTKILSIALNNSDEIVDAGHAGTAMRFLTAYLSRTSGERVLTGTERMKQRPIGVLVDALQELGAGISYMENEGYPPLKIQGGALNGKKLEMDGSISSQYITAVLLIAPTLPEGLELTLKGHIASVPYIKLTLALMNYFGIQTQWEGNTITVYPGEYHPEPFRVEADWSGASYWYEIAALSGDADITIRGLQENSLQGDSEIHNWFRELGVKAFFEEDALRLQKSGSMTSFFRRDFANQPDMVQTFAVCCAMKNIPFSISGAESLKIKETDRIQALINELAKLGVSVWETSPGTLEWDGKKHDVADMPPAISTYNDHRMALAFAPAALVNGKLVIEDPGVVVKSYPGYWDDLQKAGFRIE